MFNPTNTRSDLRAQEGLFGDDLVGYSLGVVAFDGFFLSFAAVAIGAVLLGRIVGYGRCGLYFKCVKHALDADDIADAGCIEIAHLGTLDTEDTALVATHEECLASTVLAEMGAYALEGDGVAEKRLGLGVHLIYRVEGFGFLSGLGA